MRSGRKSCSHEKAPRPRSFFMAQFILAAKARPPGLTLRLGDFARLDAAGADAHALVGRGADLDLDRTQIDVPAAARHIVRVRDVVAELRAFAADFADLSHDSLRKTWVYQTSCARAGRGLRLRTRRAIRPASRRPCRQTDVHSGAEL